jgi:hypothetical protein
MRIRRLAARLAPVAVVTAVLATAASGQLPVAFDAQVVPIAPPVNEVAYASHDYGNDGVPSADDRTATTTWRVVQATGNCCENYLTSTPSGRLYDFGGTYINYSDDRGLTWKRVTPLTPLVNGEGTIVLAPGGDVVGVGWDPYSGDHLQAYKYEADTGKWQYTETPVHAPFYDREWVSVVPGPFTIEGKTVEYISFLKGAWPSKEVWYWSTDGLNYTQVSSKIADKTLSGAAARTVATTARADNDWNQANTNTGMTTLGALGQLAAPDYPSSNTAWSLFDGKTLQWVPAQLGDGTTPSGLFQVDSAGRLHNVIPQGSKFTYRWSGDNGTTWSSLDVALADGSAVEEIDFRANRAAGVAAVLVHAQDNTTGTDYDVVYKIGIGKRDAAPKLERSFRVGLGDLNATSGLGNDVRMDFQTLTIFGDGRVAVSFLDSTTKTNAPSTGAARPSPAVAIELGTRVGRRVVTEPAPAAGTAQSPISTSVLVGAPGAGNRVVGVTSSVVEFTVPAGADDAGMTAQVTPLLPADTDLYLQRQLDDGTWSGDLASGTSGSLTDEVLESGRLLAGSRYRVEVHNWGGAPGTAGVQLTFYNSAGVPGT